LRKLYLYTLAIIFFCCEEVPDFGLEGSDIAEPKATITTSNEATFENSSIIIEWNGNPTARIFDYRLEYVSTSTPDNWTEQNSWTVPPDGWADQHSWAEMDTTSANSVEFNDLDEGVYRFYINGRYDIDNTGDESILLFKVDAIDGPALRIYPLNQTAQTGDGIDVYLYFEEVESSSAVTGLHVDIQINSSELEFVSDQFERGDLIDSFPGTVYPNPSYSDDNTSISIIMGVVDDANQNGLGIYGTGSIAKIRLKVLTCCGGQNININQIDVLDANGPPYESIPTFNDPVSGTVTVE